MAVSGASRRALGLFDEAAFGKGYGEENDFCRRAADAGWRNVLCEDAFVAHVGGQSFSPLGLKPGDESMRRLLAKHPRYLEIVSDWIERDPLAERRRDVLAAVQEVESARMAAGSARD